MDNVGYSIFYPLWIAFSNTAYCSSFASQRWLKTAMFAFQLYTMVDVQNLSPLCFMLGNKPSCFNDQLCLFGTVWVLSFCVGEKIVCYFCVVVREFEY